MGDIIFSLKNITKAFPGVLALDEVNIDLCKGEVVSLVGQNGAGKSTLVNIIGGIYTPDRGDIVLDNKKVRISNPGVSESLGIGMVHQEPTLVPNMSVMSNIFLNREILKSGFLLDSIKMKDKCKEILSFLGFKIDPEMKVENLSLVEKEVVEIAKAMLLKPRILILDEVTAPLNMSEVNHFFEIIKGLKQSGMAIVFISHRLREVISISDRVVVLRDGKKVGEITNQGKIQEKDLISLMIGQKDLSIKSQDKSYKGRNQPAFEVKNFGYKNYFNNINVTFFAGEIVGLAGLKGSGITEFLKSIYGSYKDSTGVVVIDGQEFFINNPKQAIQIGIGMVTNDRQKEGLALTRDVEENITISSLNTLSSKWGFLYFQKIKNNSNSMVRTLEIKTPNLKQEVLNLSGGNQQKVVMSKWLLKDLKTLLVDEPTRGVDVKAKSEIYNILLNLKNQEKCLIISSPEIPELLNICDRILVFSKGEIIREIMCDSDHFNESYILEILHKSEK